MSLLCCEAPERAVSPAVTMPMRAAPSSGVANEALRAMESASEETAPPTPSVLAVSASSPAPSRVLPNMPDVELLRELALGRRPMLDVIESARGVDIVNLFEGPNDAAGSSTPQKACFDAATREVKRTLVEMVDADDRMVASGEPSALSCTGLTCTKQPRMEWDPRVTFSFARKADGSLRIASIATLDVLLCEQASVDADLATIAKETTRLSLARCPRH